MPTSQETSEFEALRDELRRGVPHIVDALSTWEVHPAFFGAGTMLIGPADDNSGATLAIVPPHVWSREPDDAENSFSRTGWRLASWAEGRFIDDHRPVSVRPMTLADVVEEISRLAPEGLAWAEAIVREQIYLLESSATSSSNGIDVSAADEDMASASLLRLEAEQAFGHPLPPSHDDALDAMLDDAVAFAAANTGQL